MRWSSGILALAVAASPAGGVAKPWRVMSLNQCTDQLVLALLPPDRIASVTWLSRDPETSVMAKAAMRVGINHGGAEEVVRQKPDLVIVGSFTTPATTAMLRRLGYPILEVPEAMSFADIRSATRQVAAAVGEPARGEALIAHMDAGLAALARETVRPVRVAAWDGAGFSAEKGSLYDAVLGAAGAINLADEPPASSYGAPDAEVLLAAAPELLLQGAPGSGHPGLRDDVAHHPLVRRYWADRTVAVRPSVYFCGTPFAADGARMLRAQIQDAAARPHPPLPFAASR
ncbi:ABC transporter substrate-binding protein [Sphingomonas abietis]|uniref:ABC transporter substrate-binding protein n=1 Tax=Sphingomonas abietis TaxID=3012344 RepID=A0ABY7NIZ1_9SPHN|nr:ABC transporter substrate-binding protein [Sphingomonas abietis]WBO21491.1 ABC transporter substrate-binding protein [Sphingomonas abietis]